MFTVTEPLRRVRAENRSLGGHGRLPFWPHLQSAVYFAVPCHCHYFTTSATTWAKVPAFFNILPFVMDTELLLAHSGTNGSGHLELSLRENFLEGVQ